MCGARRSAGGITLNSINNLGYLLKVKGDLAAAELLLYRETLGDWHPITFMSINHLGQLLKDKAKGDLVAAETTQWV